MKKYLLCLIIIQTIFAFEILALPKYSTDNYDDNWEIQARIRNGKNGFEGVLFTPAHKEPNGREMNPSGAPVWNSNGNTYGVTYFNFRVSYDYSTGSAIQETDFNHDGDFDDTHERVSSTTESLIGMGFKYINLRIQGQKGQNAHVKLEDLTINDVNFGDIATNNSNHLISKLFEEDSDCGLFTDVVVTGTFTFTNGQSDELPRIWIRFGAAEEVDEKKCGRLISGIITLVDDNGEPLSNFGYPDDSRQLTWKYRCGGSWGPENSFETDEFGQFYYDIDCPVSDWDNKITVTLNQTSLEQDVTQNSVFQVAKVNVNLKDCTGNPLSGGTVEQGGGYCLTHGTTDNTGTVSFYAFHDNDVKVRMNYNYGTNTVNSTSVVAPVTDIDFTTTKVTLYGAAPIQIQAGGWPTITFPMEMLPGTYGFKFNGNYISGVAISGCEFNKTGIFVQLKNSVGAGLPNSTFNNRFGWDPYMAMGTDITGNGFIYLLDGAPTNIKVKVDYKGATLEKEQNVSVNSSFIFNTVKSTVTLLNSSLDPITQDVDFKYRYAWESKMDLPADGELLPVTTRFTVLYRGTSIEKNQNLGSNSTVEFNTVNTTVSLLNSLNTPIITDVDFKYRYAWEALMDIPTDGQLLPVTTRFTVIYRGTSIEKSQDINSNADVKFKTGKVNPYLIGGDGSETFQYRYAWEAKMNIPADMELLPVSTRFTCNYNSKSKEKSATVVASSTTNVEFTWADNNLNKEMVGSDNIWTGVNHYPNPVTDNATINYSISEASNVRIYVIDIFGNKVSELANEFKAAGDYQILWNVNASTIATGTYFYVVEAGNDILHGKIQVVK